MSDRFGNWLEHSAGGGRLDSEGQFTLSPQEAWKKLGRFRLPFAYAWLDLLVQAGVSAKAENFQIIQTADVTVLTIGKVSHWTRERVENSIFDLTNSKTSADVRYLAGALRALFTRPLHPVEVVYSDGARTFWTGSKIGQRPSHSASRTLRITLSHHREGQSAGLLSSVQSDARETRAELTKEITRASTWSPLRTHLDGRALGGIEAGRPFLGDLTHTMVCYCPLPGGTAPAFPFDPGSKEGLTELQGDRPTSPTKHGCALILMADHHPRSENGPIPFPAVAGDFDNTRSQILWWKDGVRVGRDSFGSWGPFYLIVLINATDLETDLTGLRLRESPLRERRQQEALRLAGAALDALDITIPEMPEPNKTDKPGLKPAAQVGALLSPLLLAGPAKLLWFGMVGLATAISLASGSGSARIARRKRELATLLKERLANFKVDIQAHAQSHPSR